MPPKTRFNQAAVLEAAYQLVRRNGMQALNARAVANALHCSTQPIFSAYESMENLKNAVIRRASDEYNRRILASASLDERPYKATGLAYIAFAREEPELFKLLFMCDRTGRDLSAEDASMPYVLSAIRQATGYGPEKARLFHYTVWITTHGLATMIATRYLPFSDAQVQRVLSEIYLSLKMRFDAMPEDIAPSDPAPKESL